MIIFVIWVQEFNPILLSDYDQSFCLSVGLHRPTRKQWFVWTPPPPFYFLISKIVKLQLNKYSKPRYSKLCCIVFKMHELSCPKMNLWKWCNLFVGHFKRVWSEKSLVTDLSPSEMLKQTMH